MSLNLLTGLLNRTQEFDEGMKSGKYLQSIILENETYIVNMNADDQLFDQGINRLGISIDDYAPYSEYTIEIKKAKGQPYNRVTLHDEGDFANSIFLKVGTENFEVKAADSKTQALIRKYGHQILGLTIENLSDLIWNYIFPALIEKRNGLVYGKR